MAFSYEGSTVLLVGTLHAYQENKTNWNEMCGAPQFKEDMRRIASDHKVDMVLEEMVESQTRMWPSDPGSTRNPTWMEVLANDLEIGHRFIDADEPERKELGIRIGPDVVLTPDEHEKRESYWLARIRECQFARALCVIGSKHVDSFLTKLRPFYEVAVVAHCYNPRALDSEARKDPVAR